MKFEVILTQVKSIAYDIDAKDADTAAQEAKKIESQNRLFDKRLGAIVVTRVRSVERDPS